MGSISILRGVQKELDTFESLPLVRKQRILLSFVRQQPGISLSNCKRKVSLSSLDPPSDVPDTAPVGLQGVPVGSKLLWSREVSEGGSRFREVEYGIFHEPKFFLEKARNLVHPFDSPVCIDRPNLRAIAFPVKWCRGYYPTQGENP